MKLAILAAIAAWAFVLLCANYARADESAALFFLQDEANQAQSLPREVWDTSRVIARGVASRSFYAVASAHGSIFEKVTAAAHRYGVPVNVAHAIVKKESNYRCGVRGAPTKYGRAIGIMQTIGSTARAMIGHVPRNCDEELEAGMKYLSQIVHKHGTGCAALARYEGHHYCSPYGRDAVRLARI
jgi:soluble lytic murein transglycosylase-like protein